MTDFTRRKELLFEAIQSGQYPRCLYKYRDDSAFTEAIFEQCSIWFPSPQKFNDPFDCNLSEISSHTQAEANLFLDHILEGRPDRHEILSRGTTVPEAEKLLASSKNTVLSKTGVLCLSGGPDNLLMWSHYTNSHKGLVIELDLLEDLDFFISPVRVKYVDRYTPTNYFVDQHSAITQIISMKSDCWSYEQEVRIVKKGVTGAVPINPKAIKRVIFGCKASDGFISRVLNSCSSPHLQHIKFFKADMSYGKFGLELSELAT